MSTLLVTGANRGLGLEFAREYLAAGWQVTDSWDQVQAEEWLVAVK